MARKGNHHKNGLKRKMADHTVSESADVSIKLGDSDKVDLGRTADREEPTNVGYQSGANGLSGERKNRCSGNGKKNSKKSVNLSKEKPLYDRVQSVPISCNSRNFVDGESASDDANLRGEDGLPYHSCQDSENLESFPSVSKQVSSDGEPTYSDDFAGAGHRNLGVSAFLILKATAVWMESQKPMLDALITKLFDACNYFRLKIEVTYPIIWRWLLHVGKLALLLSMVWLDCSLRGLDSLLRMGTTSFFTVIWCSILSMIAMIGIMKFVITLVVAAVSAVFIGFTVAVFVVIIFSAVFLWMYGSFWATGFVIIAGGVAFSLSQERLALLTATLYSIYCAKNYVGWCGVILAVNLSFLSSDVLIYFLKSNLNEQRTNAFPESMHASVSDDGFQTAAGRAEDCSPGEPSTSGAEMELTSEDEVIRLLNCSDHYAALGLSRYENIDVSLLKKEYRKKAMLVHPDKNMGNEKAAEAFKNLQNAYEVLLDSLKRKAYDDELRREELLDCFRKFQTYRKNGKHGPFESGFHRSEADGDEIHGLSKRIVCKKCGEFHVWGFTSRTKARARWCQDCKDFHLAKDGDGWVEQSFQPFLFGLLQKVDAPTAYICAESRIYNATEWFNCQGMRCPPNTHKPSFHVNTSITTKHSNAKGTNSGHRGGGMPTGNMDENMTEEEFFEWLQNAIQSGLFETGNMSADSPLAKASSSKSGGTNGSSSKKKKKGKRQW